MANLVEVKKGPNFIIYKNGEQKLIKIEGVRFSYPHFGAQSEDESDDGSVKKSWSGVAMLPKKTHAAAQQAFNEMLNDLQKAAKVTVPPEYRCIKNGDEKVDKAGQPDELAKGHWLISFREFGRFRPAARDKDSSVFETADDIDDKFYGGCWGSVLLRPWYFDGKAKGKTKTYPRRLLAGYNGVQFLRDDEPFGNARVDDTAAWGDESSKESGGGDDGDDL